MTLPTPRQLECLVAVAETRHFGRAAKACFISQPALSHQIQQLEGLLGLTLFERDRRHVLPTEAGQALAERAATLLGELRDFADSASAFSEPLTGTLRLGVIPTVAPYALPSLLGQVQARHPHLRIFLREGQTEELVQRLLRAELDLLLLALEADLGGARTMALASDPFLLALPKGHRLAHRKRVREADLEGEALLLLDDGHCLRDQALSFCNAAGALELDNFRASSLSTLVQMVVGGVGVTLLPRLAARVEASPDRGLDLVPFSSKGPGRTLGLAWRGGALRAREFSLLGEEIREPLGRLTGAPITQRSAKRGSSRN